MDIAKLENILRKYGYELKTGDKETVIYKSDYGLICTIDETRADYIAFDKGLSIHEFPLPAKRAVIQYVESSPQYERIGKEDPEKVEKRAEPFHIPGFTVNLPVNPYLEGLRWCKIICYEEDDYSEIEAKIKRSVLNRLATEDVHFIPYSLEDGKQKFINSVAVQSIEEL